jgi:hypothetical protein
MSYLRLTILGVSSLGESWTNTVCFDPTGELGTWDQATGQAQVDAALAVPVPTNLINIVSTAMSIEGMRLEMRDDATDALVGAAEAFKGTPLPGGGAPKMPLQCALVFSLRTDTPGPRGRGRIYWPCLSATLGSDTRFSSAALATTLADFKTWMLALQAAIGTVTDPDLALNLAVRSRTSKTTPHVKRVILGNVVDTQRRRRDKLPEVTSTVAY